MRSSRAGAVTPCSERNLSSRALGAGGALGAHGEGHRLGAGPVALAGGDHGVGGGAAGSVGVGVGDPRPQGREAGAHLGDGAPGDAGLEGEAHAVGQRRLDDLRASDGPAAADAEAHRPREGAGLTGVEVELVGDGAALGGGDREGDAEVVVGVGVRGGADEGVVAHLRGDPEAVVVAGEGVAEGGVVGATPRGEAGGDARSVVDGAELAEAGPLADEPVEGEARGAALEQLHGGLRGGAGAGEEEREGGGEEGDGVPGHRWCPASTPGRRKRFSRRPRPPRACALGSCGRCTGRGRGSRSPSGRFRRGSRYRRSPAGSCPAAGSARPGTP